jgi:hypothetical protein
VDEVEGRKNGRMEECTLPLNSESGFNGLELAEEMIFHSAARETS